MAVYIVTYDLNAPGRNYSDLIKAIKSFSHCYALKSAFFIDSHASSEDIVKWLSQYIDNNDILYVMQVTKNWACNRPMACTDWLQDGSRTWS